MTTTRSPVTVSSAAVSAACCPKFRDSRTPTTRRVGRGRIEDEIPRRVGRAVVDEDDLVGPVGQLVEDDPQASYELGEDFRLVVQRDRDREASRAHRPWVPAVLVTMVRAPCLS